MVNYKNTKFNDVYLNNICDVLSITEPILTSLDIDTLDIKNLDGEIFNGSKKNSYEIILEVLIDGDSRSDFEDKLAVLKDIFDVNEPKPFLKDTDKFIMCIPNKEIEEDKINIMASKCKITLFCLTPYYYSNELKSFENEEDNINTVIVSNKGKKPVFPFISIGFSTDAYFAQIELKSTGEKILIGKYPNISLKTSSANALILHDPCETLNNWTNSAANIDTDRSINGTLGITDSGNAICLANMGDGSTTWKGACYRCNLSSTIDEFKIEAYMRHNSTGKNGDPTLFDDDEEKIVTGSKSTYYEVTATSLNVRTGPSIKYKKIGVVTKGYKITDFTIEKGWVKFKYKDKTAYVSGDYCAKKVKDTTQTVTAKNFVVVNTTGKGQVILRSEPHHSSKVSAEIDTGDVIKAIISKTYTDEEKDSDGKVVATRHYYKLAKKYKDKYSGYICTGNLKSTANISIQYDYSQDATIADDKTGLIELYGFDSSGVKLFKIEFIDEQAYFEYTKPIVQFGARIVAQDQTKLPGIKKETTDDNSVLKTTNYLSGKVGNWNEFYGKITLTREKYNNNYIWNATIQKIVNGVVEKTLEAKNIRYTDLPTTSLSYLVLYAGTTSSMAKCCAMSLCSLRVYNLNSTSTVETNKVYFQEGDVLDIDFENKCAYINHDECTNLIDIGSRFFKIQSGEQIINTYSNDNNISTSIVIREKF